ncbi:cob(I)yrinic acid a,c-diamide adenosyltransferase [Aestuariibacter sp. A3R04]|uniref:cob(I)yrinic acid a,c-diamide adenosyltransferase n=1 Tax=Aestuariibacter sp. A3R04 TaxID=2841571 RepID=UPI001C087FCA|nr:cob(I)yrinic acid a,c-diamide adenosyltransferase [Aestuariibacter sp. A3R04]MBU3021231.1 cob(I)yrinic acid a,c-diamide adenosyltransferase [Aestuariibacter sp. A3R04]
MSNDRSNEKHKARMQEHKAKVDERVANAQEEKGILIVITGNGKGKSTSGFGTVTRAVGHGLKAAVVQYVKGTWPCGERDLLQAHGVPFHVMGTGFTWETQDKATDIAAAKKAWEQSKVWLQDPSVNLVLLDEITYMLTYKYLDVGEVVEALRNRPQGQNVVVTGRACHRAIIDIADTVSEVKSVKHAFDAGIKAQVGIDW